MAEVTVFKMLLEPHSPPNPKRPCDECVLAHGPCCLDRSYCEFKKTGKSWKKFLGAHESNQKE